MATKSKPKFRNQENRFTIVPLDQTRPSDYRLVVERSADKGLPVTLNCSDYSSNAQIPLEPQEVRRLIDALEKCL